MAAHRAALDRLLGPHLTLDEWRDLPEDVPGELVDGRLVEEEMPDSLHEVTTVRNLGGIVKCGAFAAPCSAEFRAGERPRPAPCGVED